MTGEIPVRFAVGGELRIGIVHLPAEPSHLGVLIIVGGWQYRVGSHRQFVLLGRALAEAGIAVMRFDSRGMGDSCGAPGMPEPAEHLAPDIRAALDTFAVRAAGITEFVLCGLCDGASAALTYAPTDPRIGGLVLLNPWVSNAQGAARALLRHYYWRRLREPEFWAKLWSGSFDSRRSARSLVATIGAAGSSHGSREEPADCAADAGVRIGRAMERALDEFTGRILLVLSGKDQTAAQYSDLVTRSPRWRALLRSGRATRIAMPDADHTFSSSSLRTTLTREVAAWLDSWEISPKTNPSVNLSQ